MDDVWLAAVQWSARAFSSKSSPLYQSRLQYEHCHAIEIADADTLRFAFRASASERPPCLVR